jgi:two-component system nitrate/nitrite response regulator NarL
MRRHIRLPVEGLDYAGRAVRIIDRVPDAGAWPSGAVVAMTIKVGVVDDGSVAIRGAVEVLRRSEHYCFVGEFDGMARIPAVSEAEPVVLVADPFAGPGASLTDMASVPRPFAVLVMSACTQRGTVRQALQAGARGYIGKEVGVSTLLAAISAVGVGGIYLGGSLNDVLIKHLDGTDAGPPVTMTGLTPRERDVLVMVAQGLTHKQIGTRLRLSKTTVDTYVHRVRQKVGSVNKAGLTRFAIDLGLLHDGE